MGFYAGAYWPARAEDVEACAARAERFLGDLAGIDPVLLGAWFHLGSPAATDRIATDAGSLVAVLSTGRNRRDSDGSVIEDLGSSMSGWNGDADDPANISIHCGSSSPWVPNSVVVRLPPPSQRATAINERDGASAIVKALVGAWEPDWATLSSHELREAQREFVPKAGPVLGWITFLSSGRGAVPAIDGPFAVDAVDGGALITVTGDTPPEDTEVLRSLAEQLGPDLLRATIG